jgi:lipoic acid synthetase
MTQSHSCGTTDASSLASTEAVLAVAPLAAAPAEGAPAEKRAREPKPPWLKVRAPGGENYTKLKQTLRKLDLYTVCEEARCPNVGECWSAGTATVMLLGHTCTRGCRFCAVTTGNPKGAVDPREPAHVARSIADTDLKYLVLTMVNRDDLLDGGAAHVAETVRLLKRHRPGLLVETLVGDFQGRRWDIQTVVDEGRPDVFAHNIEVVRRLTPRIRDAKCGYDLTLTTLRIAKELAPERMTKSSIMVGLGETFAEVEETMRDLRSVGVDVLTVGQYLRPTPKHAPLERYVEPAEFKHYEEIGAAMGFSYVASGPLVRSSYHAAEAFIAAKINGGQLPAPTASAYLDTQESRQHDSSLHESSSRQSAQPASQLLPPSQLIRRRADAGAK